MERADRMMITTVERDPLEVLCVAAEGGLSGARGAFTALEARLSGLRGRRFYGLLAVDGSYLACTARREDDDPEAMGLRACTVPGGRYARTRLQNWSQNLAEIGPAFRRMVEIHTEDATRPSIEYYRSETDLILFLPIV